MQERLGERKNGLIEEDSYSGADWYQGSCLSYNAKILRRGAHTEVAEYVLGLTEGAEDRLLEEPVQTSNRRCGEEVSL